MVSATSLLQALTAVFFCHVQPVRESQHHGDQHGQRDLPDDLFTDKHLQMPRDLVSGKQQVRNCQ